MITIREVLPTLQPHDQCGNNKKHFIPDIPLKCRGPQKEPMLKIKQQCNYISKGRTLWHVIYKEKMLAKIKYCSFIKKQGTCRLHFAFSGTVLPLFSHVTAIETTGSSSIYMFWVTEDIRICLPVTLKKRLSHS